jgi:DNA-binding MarR family transcriptional regulator
MKRDYYNILVSLERSYKLFLEILDKSLEKTGVLGVNNVQALIIYNLSNNEVSVGELISRGIYQGSNVSYNLKKLIQQGYIDQIPSERDKRSLHVRLTEKGREVCKKVDECVDMQASSFSNNSRGKKALTTILKDVRSLERFLIQMDALG